MKNLLLLISATCFAASSFAQITFEKGYFIDNNQRRTECLIRYTDSKNTPRSFDYKLFEDGDVKRAGIEETAEFSMYGLGKFVRAAVEVDRSGEEVKDMTKDRNPVFVEETLFLSVLVEGKSSLYSFVEGNMKRYFFNMEHGEIKALVYKGYRTINNQVAFNVLYKQQLLDALTCGLVKRNQIENLKYRERDLVNLFVLYNECSASEFSVFDDKQKHREIFHLAVRPRLNSTSLMVQYTDNFFGFDSDFGKKVGGGLGVELELVLPFFRNKWVVTAEPTFHTAFRSKDEIKKDFLRERDVFVHLTYKPREMPLGIRHYIFLNNKSKIFLNASYVFPLNSDSAITFTGTGSHFYHDLGLADGLALEPRPNFVFGAGYKSGKRLTVEFRYYTTRDITGTYIYWSGPYNSISLVAGFSIW